MKRIAWPHFRILDETSNGIEISGVDVSVFLPWILRRTGSFRRDN